MSKRKIKNLQLVVIRFSEEAVRRLRRLGLEMVEFLTPVAELFQSVFSSMAGMYEAVITAVSMSEVSLAHVSIQPHLEGSKSKTYRRVAEAKRKTRQVKGTGLPILFHVTMASKIARDLTLRAAKSAPLLKTYSETEEKTITIPFSSGHPDAQQSYSNTSRVTAEKQMPLVKLRQQNDAPIAKSVTSPKIQVTTMTAASAPFLFMGLSSSAASAFAAAVSLTGITLKSQRESTQIAVNPTSFPKGYEELRDVKVAQELPMAHSSMEPYMTARTPMPQININRSRSSNKPVETFESMMGQPSSEETENLSTVVKEPKTHYQNSLGISMSGFIKRAVAITLASGLMGIADKQRFSDGFIGFSNYAPKFEGVSGIGDKSNGMQFSHLNLPAITANVIPNPLQMIGMSLTSSGSLTCSSIHETNKMHRMSSKKSMHINGIVERSEIEKLEINPVSGVYKAIAGLLMEYPYLINIKAEQASFGSALATSGELAFGKLSECAEGRGTEFSEEPATISIPRSMQLEEPKISAASTAININLVTDVDDDDLKDLERKISKILEGQMWRYYGQG